MEMVLVVLTPEFLRDLWPLEGGDTRAACAGGGLVLGKARSDFDLLFVFIPLVGLRAQVSAAGCCPLFPNVYGTRFLSVTYAGVIDSFYSFRAF